MRSIRRALVSALLLACLNVTAAPLTPEQIPPELEGWRGWVLHGHQERLCPFLYSDAGQRRCAWPGELRLELKGSGGSFEQTWKVHARTWVSLPGNDAHWPQEVALDGEPATVTARGGVPAVSLAPGVHRVTGRFNWESPPESLGVPPDVGMLRVSVNGDGVDFPDVDAQGQLWLRGRDRHGGAVEADKLTLSVTRRLVDEIPLELITRIELDVAGSQREMEVGPVLLDEFIPLRLTSPLPARLEDNGRLRMQVRPGQWVVEFAARHPAPVEALTLRSVSEPWPQEEVWAFDARNSLRLVEISGAPAIDPRQTTLPPEWQHLPAYLMRGGDTLRFETIRRGDPQPEPDQLHLHRTLWLDFDGGGYTLQDRIMGTMTRDWRLQAEPALMLGQVTLNGEPQAITRLSGSRLPGVEVRRGQIELSADSRYAGERTLPIAWAQDFQSASATLHLPPGWRLFAAGGVDQASGGWLQRWTLLDLFVVLIAAIAVARLWSWPYGLLALITLALIWHEPGAPHYVWLHVVAAIALLRVLPPGRVADAIRIYRNLSLLALFLIGLPFLVDQVRLGVYPQLEQPWSAAVQTPLYGAREAPAPVPMAADQVATSMAKEIEADRTHEKRLVDESGAEQKRRLEMIDPDARVQTGPGLPHWQWTQIGLNWSGPVSRDQAVVLRLLSPRANLTLNLLRVVLVCALSLLLLGFSYRYGVGLRRYGVTLAGLALLLPLLSLAPEAARADFPSPELLQEFRTRLLAPPECLPACAQIPRMRFELAPTGLTIRLEVHALEQVAVTLPAQAQNWSPSEVMLDGQPAQALARAVTGELLLELAPGLHQVVLRGPTPPKSRFALPLPLKPHRVEYETEGWTVEGVHENGRADPQLQFTRVKGGADGDDLAAAAPGDLPPFVHIERTLQLGLDWYVETTVNRASPPGIAIVIDVPLLPGEAVTTEGVRVSGRQVQVNMVPGQSVFAWQSVLDKAPALTLTAAETLHWTEIWRADVRTLWHLDHAGIPPILHQSRAGQWLPEWRPWPGEQVMLNITRPEGVEGQVLTIDSSRIEVAAGKQATDVVLTLNWRSSQGGQHTLTLPDGLQLQSVTIDGAPQPIRQEGRKVTLPITPAETTAVLNLRRAEGITVSFPSPAIDLGIPFVNAEIEVRPSLSRWVLLTGGPALGPAVLFWSVLLVIAIVAYGLGRTGLTPLKGWQWFLLGLGLTQTPVWVGAVIAGWLLALGARARIGSEMNRNSFNLMQIGLACLTIIALLMLFEAVQHGLLGLPEMQIAGNGSNAHQLRWYQDRSDAVLPQAWILSVPLWVYRVLMLAWALWLAFALLDWLRWGWSSFSTHGLWRSAPEKKMPDAV